jgi:hypothetical protein
MRRLRRAARRGLNGGTMRKTMLVATLCVLAAGAAQAQTLYKLIDKNGKVTYSETAPKDFDGQVIRIDVNPDRNTATLPKYQETGPKGEGIQRVSPRPGQPGGGQKDLEALRAKVAERKAALENAENNPSDDDVQWVGNVKGGVRRIPTEEYQRRLTQLERSLKEAQDELDAAEKNSR